MMSSSIVSASLSPNTERDDVLRALKMLVTPWRWRQGSALNRVRNWFEDTYHPGSYGAFTSARAALYTVLSAMGIGEGDEVMVQAFTCVAVPNSIRWCGATPVYVDIDSSYNFDPADAAKKVTKRTKAIIIQHTFGIPANMKAIMAFAALHHLMVIEDCAHALGVTLDGVPLGTFGDAAVFSFGRDKMLSSVWGGVAIINRSIAPSIHASFAKRCGTLTAPSRFWIFQQLLHPVIFSVVLPIYRSGVGKVLIWFLLTVGLISKPVASLELKGGMPKEVVERYPNALASLLVLQLSKLSRYRAMRDEAVNVYDSSLVKKSAVLHRGSPVLRYPLAVDNPSAIIRKGKREGILLGNWYHHVIDPKGTDRVLAGYRMGSCPRAEHASLHVINLPTLVPPSTARRVVAFLSYNRR
jgi:dTDP-4-amino-4,6-dideoxygalactose transaminase